LIEYMYLPIVRICRRPRLMIYRVGGRHAIHEDVDGKLDIAEIRIERCESVDIGLNQLLDWLVKGGNGLTIHDLSSLKINLISPSGLMAVATPPLAISPDLDIEWWVIGGKQW
jgi:hypothetical protein